FIFVVSVLIISFVEDMSIVGSISASAAAITNVGPGFAEVGASQNYGFLSDFTKIYLCFLMLLGRLELYTILVLFAPIFWRK
ncbi:MAG: potassium transporter TrkG, partial [Thermodesulfobacteriota bacterium]